MPGIRWGFTFLLGNSLISHEEKLKLVAEATLLYFKGMDRVPVAGDGYEGVLFTNHEWKVIGGFSGQQFDAEIDTEADEGKVRLRLSSFSRERTNITSGPSRRHRESQLRDVHPPKNRVRCVLSCRCRSRIRHLFLARFSLFPGRHDLLVLLQAVVVR
jgi:hypothetical protein